MRHAWVAEVEYPFEGKTRKFWMATRLKSTPAYYYVEEQGQEYEYTFRHGPYSVCVPVHPDAPNGTITHVVVDDRNKPLTVCNRKQTARLAPGEKAVACHWF